MPIIGLFTTKITMMMYDLLCTLFWDIWCLIVVPPFYWSHISVRRDYQRLLHVRPTLEIGRIQSLASNRAHTHKAGVYYQHTKRANLAYMDLCGKKSENAKNTKENLKVRVTIWQKISKTGEHPEMIHYNGVRHKCDPNVSIWQLYPKHGPTLRAVLSNYLFVWGSI